MAETSGFTKAAAWFAAIVAVLVVVGMVSGQKASDEKAMAEMDRRAQLTPEQRAAEDRAADEQERKAGARYACQTAIERSLNDPGSVQWDRDPGWYSERQTETRWLIQPRARAKNAFGAYVHAVWECTAEDDGESARVTGLKQIRP